MDILSHGLYGGVLVGKKSRKSFLVAFFFGVAPDLFSFGIYTAASIFGFAKRPDWGSGHPDPSLIPGYVNSLYNVTHSLIIFSIVFGIVWLLRRKPMLEMLAWGFHILLDIFTHGFAFFPTPFLWPISGYKFDGMSWGQPMIFFPNVLALTVLYGWWWHKSRKRNGKRMP